MHMADMEQAKNIFKPLHLMSLSLALASKLPMGKRFLLHTYQ